MGAIFNFLLDNYVYVLFIAVILVLALIGYIVDTAKTNKLKKDLTKEDEGTTTDIPIANIDANVKLGDTVNKMAMNGNANVNNSSTPSPAAKADEAPKLGTLK